MRILIMIGVVGGISSYAWGNSFSCVVEPLYWKAGGEGLEFVGKVNTSGGLRGTLESLHFERDWGFQVGLGYRVPHDGWQLSLGLKHIHTNAHGKKEGSGLLPLWHTLGTDLGEVDRAEAHWRLHLGLLDGLLFRRWALTPRFSTSLCSGLRSAWIRQKYQIGYTGSSLSMKNKFWGLGPALGGTLDWRMTAQWSLFGELLFSILYGAFYVHQAEWAASSKEDLLGVHESFKNSATSCDMALGIRWQRSKWALEIAWDQILLPGQGQWIRFVSSTAPGAVVSNQGDLSLEGIRFGASFCF